MDRYKVGDLIKIKDVEDPAANFNHFYKIEKVTDTGYEFTSMTYGKYYTEQEILSAIQNFLKNEQEYVTVKDYFDNNYRLATPTEILLYGRQ